ncbi:MAG: sulfatase-like hydrolase/transferase [Bdellovibrionaceae bacterium]|nr:sulfatase-like hydrolase/transferase [Pseudobdellovibrionaceae bacterium]
MNKTIKLLVILIGCLGALPAFAQVSQRPNILLILVDDVGYADINAFASHLRGTPIDQHFRETPRIDQLAREGMMFTQFYASSVCTPTRAGLLTGKMPNRLGMWDAFATTTTTFAKTGKPLPEGAHLLDHEPWDEYKISRTDRGVSVPLAATALHDVKTIPQGLAGYHSAFLGKWHIGSHDQPGFSSGGSRF